MPEAVNSISTNAPEIHSNTYVLDKADALLGLYNVSSGLRAYKTMLTTVIENDKFLDNEASGIGFILECLIKEFDRQTDDIEEHLNIIELLIQERQSYEERHLERINEIKTILRNSTETEKKKKKSKK